MPSQATLPSQSDVWGILPLRVGSELTAQKREIWRLWVCWSSSRLSAITPPVNARDVKSLMGSPSRRVDTVGKLTCFPEMDSRAPRSREDFRLNKMENVIAR
jgi:hypothetical protein